VRIAEAGEALGLGATVSGKPYEMTAETIDPCQVTFVKRDDFPEFLKDDVEACFKVAEQLCEKNYDACKEVRSLELSQSAVEKLAKLLLEWSWPRRLDSFVRGGRGHSPPVRPQIDIHTRRTRVTTPPIQRYFFNRVTSLRAGTKFPGAQEGTVRVS
jgi:hypothetical protein